MQSYNVCDTYNNFSPLSPSPPTVSIAEDQNDGPTVFNPQSLNYSEQFQSSVIQAPRKPNKPMVNKRYNFTI